MQEQKITNFCNGNNCSRCGGCCTAFIPVSETELSRIYKYMKNHQDVITKVSEKFKELIDGENNIKCECCFYKDNSCLIYPVRPFICKKFKCNQSKEEIETNKNFAISKAKYNKNGINDLNDFWNIFFGKDFMIKLTLKKFGLTEKEIEKYGTQIK